jgi:AcrR family transcriptional regulator
MSTRSYDTSKRRENALAAQLRILDSARNLFAENGIDDVTIACIAEKAEVSESTIYDLYKSKTGILRELLIRAIFSDDYQSLVRELQKETDPLQQLMKTAKVARTIYETESRQLGSLRGMGIYSATLRSLETEFEDKRFELQKQRIETLSESNLLRKSLTVEEARRVLWALTARDVYFNLVEVGGWTPDRYEDWLRDAIVQVLLDN